MDGVNGHLQDLALSADRISRMVSARPAAERTSPAFFLFSAIFSLRFASRSSSSGVSATGVDLRGFAIASVYQGCQVLLHIE